MARKNNIRSIRFSDDLAELIDRQVGRSFTEKFEHLVTRCVWELPTKEKELDRLEKRIEEKRRQLQQLTQQAQVVRQTINSLLPKALDLEEAVNQAIEKWKL